MACGCAWLSIYPEDQDLRALAGLMLAEVTTAWAMQRARATSALRGTAPVDLARWLLGARSPAGAEAHEARTVLREAQGPRVLH
jgi:hypothetical protein